MEGTVRRGRRGKSPGSFSQYAPVANGIDLSLLEGFSPIEWDNVVLYGQVHPRSKARPPAPALHEGCP
jgi:hypothetical protein